MSHLSETSVAAPKLGNPAAVGLGAFGLTTFMLHLQGVGLIGMGPVLWLGLFYGGMAQVLVGLHEHKSGNNFGYSVFTSYGCFWLSFSAMLIASHYDLFPVSKTDVGWYLVAWAIYTGIMMIGSARANKVLFTVFVTLFSGLVTLAVEHFGGPESLATISAVLLLITAGCVWYVMAHIVLGDAFGRDVLPVGKPVL